MNDTVLRTRHVKLEFLYLDLTSCDRCIGTGSSVDRAVSLLSPVLGEIGVQLDVHKTLVGSEDEARRLGFVSSPTVLVDGYNSRVPPGLKSVGIARMNGVRTAAATAHARGEMQEVDEQLGVEEPVSAD